MSECAICTKGLTKHYGKTEALNDLDLDIQKGEVFGFLGPNGAGKTTTIRTLMDEIRPTRGSATILGKDTHKDSVELRRSLGYLPGDLAMYPNLTGWDSITYFSNLRGGVDKRTWGSSRTGSTPTWTRRSVTSPRATDRRSGSYRPS